MIIYVEESLFNSPAQVLVNTVNTVGVMGKGIAKEFKRRYPEMAEQYRKLCEQGLLTVGKLWLYRAPDKWILNFPTKRHWRERSRLEYVESGLQKFVATYRSRGITSISFPMLGCGNGQLNWDEVRPLMEKYLKGLPIPIYIHVLQDATLIPEHLVPEETAQWMRQQPRELPFSEFWSDLERQLEHNKSYATADGDSFEAYLKYNEENVAVGIVIKVAGEERYIPKLEDGFWDLWLYIRSAEYAYPDYFPAGLSKIADQVIALISQLDYIKLVSLKTIGLDNYTYGVRVDSAEPELSTIVAQ